MRSLEIQRNERILWGDPMVVMVAIALAGLGLINVYASTGVHAGSAFLSRQATGLALGLVVTLIVTRLPLVWMERLVWVGVVALCILLLLTLLSPLGVMKNGARRSMNLGAFFLMPAELAKPALLLWTAYFFSLPRSWTRQDALTFAAGVILPLGLIVGTKDLGTPVVLAAGLFTVWFLSGAPWRYMVPTLGVGAGIVWVLIATAGHRLRYVRAWMDPYCSARPAGGDPVVHRACLDETNALRQSYQAIADGGLFGTPLGGGQGPLHVMEGHNDFIGALVAEQFGLLGLIGVAVLFTILLIRGLRIAARAPSRFAGLVVSGAASLIFIQAAVHLAVVSGTIPPKGLTLPLVSAGNSSMLATACLIGFILNIARHQTESVTGEEPR
ncbi:MAG: FtsW/RodA/SpoVE family cell cycle protein [Myxococcota bacterium]|nr:hypothetical protein [Myxococcales bacterium]MEC7752054.1 FtsW/RodA/SpoVE family cell cycle protein [Myxococcota bacterium]HBU47624.1 hypothetical protein [Myxococcales bacterium]